MYYSPGRKFLSYNLLNQEHCRLTIFENISTLFNPINVDKTLMLKNCASFIKYMSKINNAQADDAHDIDIVMSIHNLIEYSDNYSKTFGILWQCFEDERAINVANSDIADFNVANATRNLFKSKEKMACKQAKIDVELMVSLKYLSVFCGPLEIL